MKVRLINLSIIIVVALLFVGFFYSVFQARYSKYLIRRNMDIVNGGRIVKMSTFPKSYNLFIVTFEYSISGKNYSCEVKSSYNLRKGVSLKENSFPVAYQNSNKSNAFILVKPEDFEYFNISFPDSLNWFIQSHR